MVDLFYYFTPYQNNITPLYVASLNGHHDVVQTLVGAGADVNTATSDVRDMVLRSYTSTCTLDFLLQGTCFINKCIVYRLHFCTLAHFLWWCGIGNFSRYVYMYSMKAWLITTEICISVL